MENENKHTYDNGFHPKEVVLKENYKFYNYNIFFRFFGYLLLVITRIWLIIPKLIMGFKIKGNKNRKGVKGAIVISNHIHMLDAFFLAASFYGTKTYVTMLQSNLGFGIVSKYMRIAAAVPIPTERRLLRRFNEQTKDALNRGKNIIIYPEAALMPYCDHIRNFLPGAFHYAVVNDAPIIPAVYTFHKPKGLRKLFRKKPVIHLNFLEVYHITQTGNRSEDIKKTCNDLNKIVTDFFNNNSDYFYENGEKIITNT